MRNISLVFVLALLACWHHEVTGRAGRVSRSDDVDPVQNVVDQLVHDMSSLKAELTAAKQRISELEATNSRHVAFTAYISDEPGIQVTVPHAVVPFRGVINIVGNAYNPATSAFTAPYDGDYFFIVHADVSPDYRSMEVRKNDVRVFAGDNDNHDGHVTASGVLRLKAGDVITATHYTHATGGTVDAGNESTFSGFLLR